MNKLTLGSLFDGSGGFPLGGLLCGIEPLWASEIEPFPIRVTTKRIPQMKHYGDISTLNGADLPPVDIITFGSPCTDMSVAGKRAGLAGEQSVLFYEAIRIIKEMRCRTNGRYPRYAVWENVPGAFSSNKGADFKAVLEAVISVIEPTAEVPAPDNGRWPYADLLLGNGWSGGIAVVALQGSMIGRENKNGPQGSGIDEDVSFTLNTIDRHAVAYAMTTGGFTLVEEEKSPTLLSRDYKDAPIVSLPSYGIDRAAFNQGQNALYKPATLEEQPPTLTAKGPGAMDQPASFSPHPNYIVRRLTPTECARLQGFPDGWCADLGTENPTEDEIMFWTAVWEVHRKIMGTSEKSKSRRQIIKWLQNPHSDAAEYKMWGNGVALPCVCFVLSGIVSCTQDSAE